MSATVRTSLAFLVLGFGIATACGKSEVGGDDDATGGAAGTGSLAWAACELPSDCVLAADSCCGVCGEPTLGDVDGVNRGHVDEHFEAVCPEPVPCPLCPTQPNPDLHATCDEGACRALDIHEHAASACGSDDDCRLRVTGCCECDGSTASWDLIAIRRDGEADYQALVCDLGQVCDDCAPIYPVDVEAYCAAEGHCAVRSAGEGKAAACVRSGGTVETTLCCSASDDFPNLCLIGACGCSLENSVPTETCHCEPGRCFDGTQCIAD